jgi:hypothetical protein
MVSAFLVRAEEGEGERVVLVLGAPARVVRVPEVLDYKAYLRRQRQVPH